MTHVPIPRLPAAVRKRWSDLRWRWRVKYGVEYAFVHINKTGGSSIERALGLRFRHRTARELRRIIGPRRWERRFTFAVVRNPWDKVVSHYEYRWQRDETGLRTDQVSFADWVRLAYTENDPRYYNNPKMFMPQLDWIADEQGTVLVDFIARFERLQDDFDVICRRLGVTAALPHLKKTDHVHYRQYYTAATREMVARWFERDIARFGYTFAED